MELFDTYFVWFGQVLTVSGQVIAKCLKALEEGDEDEIAYPTGQYPIQCITAGLA